jgi:hypothetical protein
MRLLFCEGTFCAAPRGPLAPPTRDGAAALALRSHAAGLWRPVGWREGEDMGTWRSRPIAGKRTAATPVSDQPLGGQHAGRVPQTVSDHKRTRYCQEGINANSRLSTIEVRKEVNRHMTDWVAVALSGGSVHAARTPIVPFNATFYATAATVIPVLFLAIAIQGQTYQHLLEYYMAGLRSYRAEMRELRVSGKLTLRRVFASGPAVQGPGCLGALVLAAGIFGEIDAMIALYQQRTGPSEGPVILLGTILLILMAASGPFGTYMKLARQDRVEREKEVRGRIPPKPQVEDEQSVVKDKETQPEA